MSTYYPPSSLPTSGAIPVVNEKGQVTMQKVKVTRYQPGKKPAFARDISSEEDASDNEDYQEEQAPKFIPRRGAAEQPTYSRPREDRRHQAESESEEDEEEDRRHHYHSSRRRRDESDEEEEEEEVRPRPSARRTDDAADARLRRLEGNDESYDARLERRRALLEEAETGVEHLPVGDESEEDEARQEQDQQDEDEVEEDEDEVMRRRQRLREMARARQTEEVMAVEEDQEDEVEDEEEEEEVSEYEEYEDEEDDMAARLKPVFVRKTDRVTLQEHDDEAEGELADEEAAADHKKTQDERKQIAKKLVEDAVRREIQEERERAAAAAAAKAGGVPIPAAIASLEAASAAKHPGVEGNFNFGAVGLDKHIDADNMTLVAMALEDVVTDEEGSGDVEYEKWKLRELKRIKRDRDERDQMLREKEEIEAVHNMTEEERKAYLAANPKLITNKADKGKYKFLQKYYHRGAFFLDKDEDVLKRSVADPTLEDHFDRSLMPKVMQVKNFGKKGRTKYTHLVDQDTSGRDAPWTADAGASLRWHQTHGGGTKQVFEKPSTSAASSSSKQRKQ